MLKVHGDMTHLHLGVTCVQSLKSSSASMAPLSVQNLRIPPLDSQFLGETRFSLINSPCKQSFRIQKAPSTSRNLKPTAKFNLSEVMGGRGLCNGERGLQLELQRMVEISENTGTSSSSSTVTVVSSSSSFEVPENAFEKELLGLTGGFPGGEKGLKNFIEKQPPRNGDSDSEPPVPFPSSKPKPPELPLLMPGMIAIVKNPNNPFYMYCGIVQRITDGKAGVLFEGGNWDKLVTFRLDELQRREKGPPMVNPKSAVLESMLPKESSSPS
ncbi:NAD(P)H-quinone oxidoreductase subunit S, chloroplastic [Macadamia integrifolia]|uniref:NAD(P)H-quinone oxidoreductase subunit S, chloroplastic n=1 Tax=Macadamia integrifolia TaxID=60698 RepID=UPI001C52CD9B|nr:NAD(P)H-quinone oxidoreductase subunit S, chloroplastic [Macadamia integrifolia]